jgi:hypothetical protein
MKNALIAILLCGVAVAACDANRVEEQEKAAQQAAISVDSDWEDGKSGNTGINIKADMESGEVELKLPGGLEGKVKIPDGLEPDAKFNLDGLGRYPGAKLVNVDVQASGKDDDGRGQVVMGFTAPGTAGQVTSWYEKALADKGRSPARSGNTLTSTTKDGDRMVIAVDDGTGGIARGRITITDKKG